MNQAGWEAPQQQGEAAGQQWPRSEGEGHDDKKLSLGISYGGRARDQCSWPGERTRHARRDGIRDDARWHRPGDRARNDAGWYGSGKHGFGHVHDDAWWHGLGHDGSRLWHDG